MSELAPRARRGTGAVAQSARLVAFALCALGLLSAPAVLAQDKSNATSDEPGQQRGLRVTGGFGRGVSIGDDAFGLTVRGRMQARAAAGLMETGNDDEFEPSAGMLIRRMRLQLTGHAFGQALTYYLQLGFAPLDLDPEAPSVLRDAYGTWRIHRDLQLRFGQMKVPFDRQRVNSSSALQMVDRSIVTSALNLDRDVGVQLLSTDLFGLAERLRYNLGMFAGNGRNRTLMTPGFLYVGRLELSPFGAFDDAYSEADLERSARPRLVFGVAAAYNRNTDRVRSTIGRVLQVDGVDYAHFVADWAFKWRGLSVAGGYLVRRATTTPRTGEVEGAQVRELTQSGHGTFVQLGQLLTPEIELVARYGVIKPLGEYAPHQTPLRELGGGVNYYVVNHSLKVQLDYFHLLDDFGVEQHQARLQTQIYF